MGLNTLFHASEAKADGSDDANIKQQASMEGHTNCFDEVEVSSTCDSVGFYHISNTGSVTTDSESDIETDTESDYDSSDDEVEELDEEVLLVLEDAKRFKLAAKAFCYPEEKVNKSFGARCYFDRASAPEVLTKDEADTQAEMILDVSRMKKLAVDFLNAENEVKSTDPLSFGRNYFTSCVVADAEEADEVAQVLAETKMLKEQAASYLCPEENLKLKSFGARCYFDRASAPEVVTKEEADTQAEVLSDVIRMKKLAADFLNGENETKSTDGFSFGRNYFSNLAECKEEVDERAQVLAEARLLKEQASKYLCPEEKVKVESFGSRCYFKRASAPETVTKDEADVQSELFLEATLMEKQAVDFLYPENESGSADALSFARNYFTDSVESKEEADERAQALAEARLLKEQATNYYCPEKKVTVESFGSRCYFERASAPETVTKDEADVQSELFLEATLMEKQAVDFLYPENELGSTDALSFGRNYFTDSVESKEVADERAQALAEARLLKEQATNYYCPEKKVTVESFGSRCYFERASAPETVTKDEADAKAELLSDATLIKKLAIDFVHPENQVKSADAFSFGRNYFTNCSSVSTESTGEVVERAQVIDETTLLKEHATNFLCPELDVSTTDPSIYGRNYFGRVTTTDVLSKEDADEVDGIINDANVMKVSVDYLCPEVSVENVHPFASGRNYFENLSSYPTETEEESNERLQILADSVMLKQAAVDYLQPEVILTTTDPTLYGRNIFDNYPSDETRKGSQLSQSNVSNADENNDYFVFDDFHDLREELKSFNIPKYPTNVHKSFSTNRLYDLGVEKERPVSRSPSCVMLFGLDNV